MVGITGIRELVEPVSDRRVQDRGSKDAPKVNVARDGVQFSEAAQEASSVAKFVELSESDSDLRQERVAEAKQNIEDGTYRVGQVVLQVAARIAIFIDN